LLDLCSGSGCIGIALKKRFPQLKVILSDLSEKALLVAKKNAKRNGVDVEFLQGDFLKPFEGREAHFVVCNPPYLSSEEHLTLSREVKEFEPYSALVSGETGLEFYEALAAHLPVHLHPGARVWLELGFKQGASLNTLFASSSWASVVLEQDWAGHDRFLTASKP
jgi:release factor glutamine methyltransferase